MAKNKRMLDKAKKDYSKRRTYCRIPGWIIVVIGVLFLLSGFIYGLKELAQVGGVLTGAGILVLTFGDIVLTTLFKK